MGEANVGNRRAERKGGGRLVCGEGVRHGMHGRMESARVELSSDAGVSQEVGTGSLCEVEKFSRYDACSGVEGFVGRANRKVEGVIK